jgi:antitoxin VapB
MAADAVKLSLRADRIGIYSCICKLGGSAMQRRAKIFMNNRSQAVRIPKEFRFSTSEVYIRKEGDEVILSPRPADWSAYLQRHAAASEEFMNNVEELPFEERSF